MVFAWIAFKSRAHLDLVNAKVMNDPRIKDLGDPTDMPFDVRRMTYGGFKIRVEAGTYGAPRNAPLHRFEVTLATGGRYARRRESPKAQIRREG